MTARVGFRSLANSNIIDNHIEVVGLRSSAQATRAKVFSHLMFGVLVLTVDQLVRFVI